MTEQKRTESVTILGDSRHLTDCVEENSIDLMITSPPYPGDHEYTKHSKLEPIFNGYRLFQNHQKAYDTRLNHEHLSRG